MKGYPGQFLFNWKHQGAPQSLIIKG